MNVAHGMVDQERHFISLLHEQYRLFPPLYPPPHTSNGIDVSGSFESVLTSVRCIQWNPFTNNGWPKSFAYASTDKLYFPTIHYMINFFGVENVYPQFDSH